MTLLTFGQYITMKREQQRLTQTEAATRMKVSIAALSKWEKDVNLPSKTSADRLIKLYNLSSDELEPYQLEDKVVKKLDKPFPIAKLLERTHKAMNLIEENMQGLSVFEKNIKNKAASNLQECIHLLEQILIVDEAF